MARDVAWNNITHPIVEIQQGGNAEVPYNAAMFTDKVVVLVHCCIVAMKPFSKIEFLDFSLSCEDVEISIDRAKGDPGYLCSYLLVYPFGSRMTRRLFQNLINSLPLPASFRPDGLHGTSRLFVNPVAIYANHEGLSR